MIVASLVKRKVQIAFGSAIVILLIMGALSYRSIGLSNESDRWVQHTRDVLEELQNVNAAMAAISSSIRRYVITGEESDLEPYHAAKSDVERLGPVLRSLTQDNPAQQRRLPVLEKMSTPDSSRPCF